MRPFLAMAFGISAPLYATSPPADLVLCAESQAPEYSSDLMAKIETARAINQPGAVIEIRIGAGTFTKLSSMSGAFELIRPCSSGEICFGNKTLRLRGGYQEDTGCSIRNPRLIQTGIATDALGFRAGGDFDLEFDGVHVLLQGPAEVDVYRCAGCASSRSVRITDSVLSGVHDLAIHAGSVELTNNWLEGVGFAIGSSVAPAHEVRVGFNTFRSMPSPALHLISRSNRAHIHHNVVAHHPGAGIDPISMRFDVLPGIEPLIQHNAGGSFLVLHGSDVLAPAAGSIANQISDDIGFAGTVMGPVNPLLRESPPSLAINAGMTLAELSAAGIEPPRGDVQLAVNPRLVGGRYDLGAFESSVDEDPDRLHISGFE